MVSLPLSGFKVNGELINNSGSLALVLHGKNSLLWLLPATWGSNCSNKRILFFCDNKSVAETVNSKRSRIPRIMDLVRHLTLVTLNYNFYLKVHHIEGKRNQIADSLSRFQMEKFRILAPHADPAPSPKTQELWEI